MPSSLHITYICLLSTTLISSCFLFLVVANENPKHTAASNGLDTRANTNVNVNANMNGEKDGATMAEAAVLTANAQTISDKNGKTQPSSVGNDATEKILPNYKKVKKLYRTAKTVAAPSVDSLVVTKLGDLIHSKLVPDVPIDSPESLAQEISRDKIQEKNENQKMRTNDELSLSEAYVQDKLADAIVRSNGDRSVSAENVLSEPAGIEVGSKVKVTQQQSSQTMDNTVDGRIGVQTTDESGQMLLKFFVNYIHCEFKKFKAHLTMFFIFFWVIWCSQILAISTIFLSLPSINDIPTMVVKEMPLELLEPAIILDAVGNEQVLEGENHTTITLDLPEVVEEAPPKDDEIVKIDDSGGTKTDFLANKSDTNIPIAEVNVTSGMVENATTGGNVTSGANQTAEEVPIPVFSEWAQKQMEAAEKQQALEQEVVNTSTLKKNQTNGSGKAPSMKIRSKNYASPDCGAKIIASNADATNTGAVLSSSKDEYMLSPCGNRIWFVVELCEAIQAQKIELANFELFSSSPKNFTVAVSNRFPTREWSNVGRFVADDKRNVQSFNLHPHLFGKFVRVDIHSHYSKEHFCPVSLFRVFGTSEFEAFETEVHPDIDLDDDEDDEFGQDQASVKNSENNLFKSASDAVLSIVKKAAEVLVKPSGQAHNQTVEADLPSDIDLCQSCSVGVFTCPACSDSLVAKVNHALTCQLEQLNHFFAMERLRNDLIHTQVCGKEYGMQILPLSDDDSSQYIIAVHQSYLLSMLPREFIGALCHLEAAYHTMRYPRRLGNHPGEKSRDEDEATFTQNQTIKMPLIDELKIDTDKPMVESAGPTIASSIESQVPAAVPVPNITDGGNYVDEPQTAPSPVDPCSESSVEASVPNEDEASQEEASDVNIYNLPNGNEEELLPETSTEIPLDSSSEQSGSSTEFSASNAATPATPPRSDEDVAAWDSLDNLLAPTPAHSAPTNGGSHLAQQKVASSPQSESVFIRLSNRIKTLERNMSLSGQYLEELSRRYKKQVEELQQTLNQQTQTVRKLEEDTRRRSEMEQIFSQRNHQLKAELDALSLQVQACIVVIICVGTFVLLLLVVSILFYRTMRRQHKALLAQRTPSRKRSNNAQVRKSQLEKPYGDCAEIAQLPSSPCVASGEAMVERREVVEESNAEYGGQVRQRKVSVYSSSQQISNTNGNASNSSTKVTVNKRKGEKHSWPTGLPNGHEWSLIHSTSDKLSKSFEHDKTDQLRDKENQPSAEIVRPSKATKKTPNVRKSKAVSSNANSSLQAQNGLSIEESESFVCRDYDESLLLDEDGLDNYLPNADLSYNEFMPEGPSGYQVNPNTASSSSAMTESDKSEGKKSRRLSSPAFFKSPFSKSLKLKQLTPNKNATPHESTSWEWYRLRKSAPPSSSTISEVLSSPVDSMDSTSLSEINFAPNSNVNSFRILEEAILSSGESLHIGSSPSASLTSNGKSLGHSGASGSASSASGSSNRSTSSSTKAKKKNRSFNKIFRKVF